MVALPGAHPQLGLEHPWAVDGISLEGLPWACGVHKTHVRILPGHAGSPGKLTDFLGLRFHFC